MVRENDRLANPSNKALPIRETSLNHVFRVFSSVESCKSYSFIEGSV